MSQIATSSKEGTAGIQKHDFEILCAAVIPKASYKEDMQQRSETQRGAVASEACKRAEVPTEEGIGAIRTCSFPLYWFKIPKQYSLPNDGLEKALTEILTDPLQEELWLSNSASRVNWCERWLKLGFRWWAERQFLPGVTDNLSHTVAEAINIKGFASSIGVASGTGYLFTDESENVACTAYGASPNKVGSQVIALAEDIKNIFKYKLYHPLTDRFEVHDLLQCSHAPSRTSPQTSPHTSSGFLTFPTVELPEPPAVSSIDLEIEDEELELLSRNRLLALTLDEMKAIRAYYRQKSVQEERLARGLSANPTDVELEIIAQTWSEHCKHKIFNASITFTTMRPNQSREQELIKSLYKTYIQAATQQLMQARTDLLSVFEDNSGVVRWNNNWAICFKVETHNSPSALEPYGGALTGILGVNRDILGTGIGAQPLFNTDVFCFAYPSDDLAMRPKLLPAKSILEGVRKGVEDGGNKSGIPTVNGAIYFDKSYRAKPLVFCGTGGILPTEIRGVSGYAKHTQAGDTVVMVGGRVGKDGVHGATFSSESLHEGSPVSAVQIGDPFTQKRVLDFVLDARDSGLITGITDNGAGGLSSSVGEMARLTGGAVLELSSIPTKYPGLSDWEIVVSESQERMTISTKDLEKLKQLGRKHNVEVTEVGKFTTSGYFAVSRDGKPVALLDLRFLHEGIPELKLHAEWTPPEITINVGTIPSDWNEVLLKLLSHPNICSRASIIRQYDHEVQGMSVIKPLMGPKQQAPNDAAVITPILGDKTGLAISNGLCPKLSTHDPYLMAVCAVDEAIRNAVCVGADPKTISLLDNFCWPDPVESLKNPHGKHFLASLVRTCQGLYDAVLAYGAPLISGKDSMKNDFDDGVIRLSILPTLLVSAIGKVPDAEMCVSMEFKKPGDLIYLLSAGMTGLAGSHYEELQSWQSSLLPSLDLSKASNLYNKLHEAIKAGWIQSAHDVSEGGIAVSLAECVIGSDIGANVDLDKLPKLANSDRTKSLDARSVDLLMRPDIVLFGEGPAKLLVTVNPGDAAHLERLFEGLNCLPIGTVLDEPRLRVSFKDSDKTTSDKTADDVAAGSSKQRRTEPSRFVIDLTYEKLEGAWKTRLPFD